jgi:hypothetical protein
LCKMYVSWQENHSSTSLLLLIPDFTKFPTEPNPAACLGS